MKEMQFLNQFFEVNLLDSEGKRRAQLLDILIFGIAGLALIALIGTVLFADSDVLGFSLLIMGAIVTMIGMIVVFIISHYWSYRAGSWLFLFFLVIIFALSDVPAQVVGGRGLFTFTIPIMMSSFLLNPRSSFQIAGFTGLLLNIISFNAQLGLNAYVIAGFLAVALVAWLAARSLEKALQDLRASNEKLSQANELLLQEIDERKQAQRELARKARSLARSNTELQQFAYVATHDLREPLRSVRTYTELLAQRYEGQLDSKADKYINYIVKGANRMQTLITDLLTYSKVGGEALILQTIDLNLLLDKVLTDLEGIIRVNEAAVTVTPLPTITADSSQVNHLFQNLISNAIKFKREEPPAVHISAEEQDGEWVFAVSDNGIGIEPQYEERIFVIFKRLHTKDKYPGTGIGLAICKKVVENHNGRIWLESTIDQGSTFYFTLPSPQAAETNNDVLIGAGVENL